MSASAELDGDAPFTVEATDPGTIGDEDVDHDIVFTVEGDRGAVVGDVRWTFGELVDGEAFATAGHGCGARVEEADGEEQVAHVCTEEFRILEVRPGEPLRETVTVSGPLHGRVVAEGTFTFEQPLRWWYAEDPTDDPADVLAGDPDGEATVRLTYEITRPG